jgi:hypothetical protein
MYDFIFLLFVTSHIFVHSFIHSVLSQARGVLKWKNEAEEADSVWNGLAESNGAISTLLGELCHAAKVTS